MGAATGPLQEEPQAFDGAGEDQNSLVFRLRMGIRVLIVAVF